jgi:hypothetical protein
MPVKPTVTETEVAAVHTETAPVSKQRVTGTNPVISAASLRRKSPLSAKGGDTESSEVNPRGTSDPQNCNDAPEEKTKQTQPIQSGQQWHGCFEMVTGLAHRDANPPLPCQDSAIAVSNPRPVAIVADGAGSSAVSEIGSQAVTTGLIRLLHTLEQQVALLLDQPNTPQESEARNFGLLLVKHAKGILDDLAVQHRRALKDFRCTLLLMVRGQKRLLWVKVGDGALITESMSHQDDALQSTLSTLGEVGKGEFANSTTFIDNSLQPTDVQTGMCSGIYITGFAAMSDGAADRLVSNDGRRVSGQVGSWLHALRQQTLKRRELTRLLNSEAFTKGTTGDDASIALCACTLGDTIEPFQEG